MNKRAVLYISYDGMLEPLGQSQVLSYLERLAADYDIHLISFEKPADWANTGLRQRVGDRISAAKISWRPLTYHKSPSAPATAYDIAAGTALALWITLTKRVDLVHARSYVPGVMAAAVKKVTGARFLFDMRGFWADERTDGGIWPVEGRLYRTAKSIERWLLSAADHIVTLTHASAKVLPELSPQTKLAPVTVIPTCADLDRFALHPAPPANPFVLGYVGSVGTWYLWDETLAFFKALKKRCPDARFLIVNRNEHAFLREAAAKAGIDASDMEIVAAEHRDVPALIGRMHAAAALIKPSFSKIASAPTKLAEYLGCGVPCLGNKGVGDVDDILTTNRTGIAVADFSPATMERAADAMLKLAEDPLIRENCRQTAERLFALEQGVAAYRNIYAGLAS